MVISRSLLLIIITLVFAACEVGAPTVASGQTYKDALRCISPEEAPGDIIHFCTKVIDSGDATEAQLGEIFHSRGRAYAAEGEYSKAISDYSQAFNHPPVDANLQCDRGNAYGALGQYDKAAGDCLSGAEKFPDNASAWSSACKWFRRDGQPTEAEAACARAKELDPNCEVCTSLGVTITE